MAHVNLVCVFACPLQFWPERVVACRVSLSSVSSGCDKLVGGICVSRLVLGSDFFGLCKILLRTCSTVSSDVFLSSRFFFPAQTTFLFYFFVHVQICIAVGDCFDNSLTSALKCDPVCSNTLNTFSLPLKGISISVKIKTSNIRHNILTCLKTSCHDEKKL